MIRSMRHKVLKMYKGIVVHLLFFVTVLMVTGHNISEEAYWSQAMSSLNLNGTAYDHNRSVEWQLQFMIPPGGRCDEQNHQEAVLRHHLIRHGHLIVRKEQFITFLNEMCAMMPYFHVNGLHQVYRCNKGRCDCPFEFLTWDLDAQQCKIRAGFYCGDVQLQGHKYSLDFHLGCEGESKCLGIGEHSNSNNGARDGGQRKGGSGFPWNNNTLDRNRRQELSNASQPIRIDFPPLDKLRKICKCKRHNRYHSSRCIGPRSSPSLIDYLPPSQERSCASTFGALNAIFAYVCPLAVAYFVLTERVDSLLRLKDAKQSKFSTEKM